jgi:LDH2 family malate/lactate/ureidoglycolate dehydrogenase
MILSIADARALVEAGMIAVNHTREEAQIIADHLIDCEVRGLGYGGLSRAISVIDRIRNTATPRRPITMLQQSPVSASLDGGDNVGYLVGRYATEIALEKVKANGIAIVAAHNTWYTGMLSYYAEMAVAAGKVVMIASNATAWVAPHAATEGRFGTNPMCFGFPGKENPVIWDIGTSIIIHADAMLANRLGQPIAEGVAYDSKGHMTTDPKEALSGALMAWGGAKGSGLGLVVQLLGIMAGSTVIPQDLSRFGFLMVLVDPGLLSPGEDFSAKVSAYVDWVHSARPSDPDVPVRVPFERSMQDRARRMAEGFVEIPDLIHSSLLKLAA